MTDNIELYSIQHYPAGTGIKFSRKGMSRAAVILRKKPKDVLQSEKARTTYNDPKSGFYLKGRCVFQGPGGTSSWALMTVMNEAQCCCMRLVLMSISYNIVVLASRVGFALLCPETYT